MIVSLRQAFGRKRLTPSEATCPFLLFVNKEEKKQVFSRCCPRFFAPVQHPLHPCTAPGERRDGVALLRYFTFIEYSDEIGFISFDSYMISENDLEKGQLRLLEVDNPLVLPTNTHIRVLVTASDVLHSWAIPSLGVKMDAVPGRLNQTSIFIKRPGTFYGQCSELCGVNHGFMPIKIKAMPFEEFYNWAISQ